MKTNSQAIRESEAARKRQRSKNPAFNISMQRLLDSKRMDLQYGVAYLKNKGKVIGALKSGYSRVSKKGSL